MDQAEALQKARKFAENAYSAEMNTVAREFNAKIQAAQNQAAARGTVQSGLMTAEIARLTGERVTTLVKRRLELLLEGYQLHGVEITDQIAAQTRDEVMQLHTTMIAAAAASGARVGVSELPGGSGPQYAQLLEQHVPVNAASIMTEIERRRLTRKKSEQATVNVYHVYGHQPRWVTNSIDNSVNIVNATTEQVFTDLRQRIAEGVPAGDEQADILDRLSALEQAQGTPSFGKRYSDFIASAANHMVLIAPFIPALTELLSRTIT